MTVNLTDSDITLLRVALMQRCERIKSRKDTDMKGSYDGSIDLLFRLWIARENGQGEPK